MQELIEQFKRVNRFLENQNYWLKQTLSWYGRGNEDKGAEARLMLEQLGSAELKDTPGCRCECSSGEAGEGRHTMLTDINPFDDWRSAQQFAESHICATCRHTSALVVRWHEGHEVYCPKCKQSDRFETVPSLADLWRRNPDSVPITVANRLERMHRRKAGQQTGT